MDGLVTRVGVRGRTLLCQLPLSVTMGLVVALAALFNPSVLHSAVFLGSLVVHLLLLILSAVVPWERLPSRSWMVVPVLDCLTLGFSREAGGETLSVLGFLLVFPVIWLSASRHPFGAGLAVVSTAVSAVLPPLLLHTGFATPGSLIRPVMLPVAMTGVAVTAHLVFVAVVHQRERLGLRERRVQSLLEASRRRESLLDAVVETVNVGILVLDGHGTPVLRNRQQRQSIARLVGTEDASPGGLPAPLPLYAADGSTLLPEDRYPISRAGRGEAFTEELVWFGADTDQRAFNVTARPLTGDDGAFAGSVVTFTDITGLVAALKAKDDFVAAVSHELRTPLTSILGYLALALDEEPGPDIVRYLHIIGRNGERLLKLVTDLLAVASDTVDAAPTACDLCAIITGAVEAARPAAEARDLALVLDLPDTLPLSADPARVAQVFENLISNAVKYTPGPGTITLTARQLEGTATCTVADTGVGMSPDEQEHAFARFFRAPPHAKQRSRAQDSDCRSPRPSWRATAARSVSTAHPATAPPSPSRSRPCQSLTRARWRIRQEPQAGGDWRAAGATIDLARRSTAPGVRPACPTTVVFGSLEGAADADHGLGQSRVTGSCKGQKQPEDRRKKNGLHGNRGMCGEGRPGTPSPLGMEPGSR